MRTEEGTPTVAGLGEAGAVLGAALVAVAARAEQVGAALQLGAHAAAEGLQLAAAPHRLHHRPVRAPPVPAEGRDPPEMPQVLPRLVPVSSEDSERRPDYRSHDANFAFKFYLFYVSRVKGNSHSLLLCLAKDRCGGSRP